MSTGSPAQRRRRATRLVFAVGTVVQVALIVLGIAYILTPTTRASVFLLIVWCGIGSLYVVGIWGILAAASRWEESDEPPLVLELSRPVRVIALLTTVLVSAVGVAATVQHIFLDPSREDSTLVNVVGIWAMILAWMLLHWGFAQLYLQRYYRDETPPLAFPKSKAPGILEFAYFSYTVAVSFAVSDVEVRDRAMRWRVMSHAVVSFFFNGLIIVTALGAIAAAGRG